MNNLSLRQVHVAIGFGGVQNIIISISIGAIQRISCNHINTFSVEDM